MILIWTDLNSHKLAHNYRFIFKLKERIYNKMKTSHGHETFLGGELANSLYESIQEKSREQASLLVESRLTEFIKNGEPRKIAEYVLLFED